MVDNLARASYSDEQKPSVEVNESPVKWCSVSLSEIVQRGKRLEASAFDVEAKYAHELIVNNKFGYLPLLGKKKFRKKSSLWRQIEAQLRFKNKRRCNWIYRKLRNA